MPPIEPLALTAMMGIFPVIAALIGGPDMKDIMSAFGAVPASVIVLLYCSREGKTFKETVSAFLASGACGIIAPGAVLWNMWPSMAEHATWHIWAFFGLIASLAGWSVVAALLKVFEQRAPAMVEDAVDRYIPGAADKRDPKL